MAKYLDKIGLSYFWSLIKSKLIPTGGQEGQVLAKASNADDDVEWISAGTNNIIGDHLIAASLRQIVIGQYNEADTDEHAIIVGNGTSESDRSNAFAVDRDGVIDIGPQELSDSDSGLRVFASNISNSNETAASQLYGLVAGVFDKAGGLRSYLKHVDLTDGSQGVQVETRRVVNGSQVYNGLQMRILPNGTRGVYVSEAAPWREAIGAAATTNGGAIHDDSFASAERGIIIGGGINNSASPYNGRRMNLYVKTNGLNTYITGGSQAAETPWSLLLPSGTTDLRLQTTSLNLTTTNIGGGTKTIYFAKQGNIVIATFTGWMNPSAANTVYTIGTIPSGYRPARAAHASVRGKTNNIVSTASAAAKFVFNTGGSIQVRIGATGAYDYDFTTMWWTS